MRIKSRLGSGIRFLVGIAVGAVFLFLALRGVDVSQILLQLSDIEFDRLPAVFLALASICFLRAFRWKYLITPLKRVSFWRSFRATVVGFMANNAVPLRGGDLLQAHLLGRREDIRTVTVFATVGLDRIFSALSLLTVTLVMMLAVPLPVWVQGSVFTLGLTVVGSAVAVLLFRRPPIYIRIIWDKLIYFLPEKLAGAVSSFVQQARLGLETARGKIRIANMLGLALTESALWIIVSYLAFVTIGIKVPLVAVMGAVIAINLAVVVPIAPGNIGIFEFSVMAALGLFHLDKSVAVSGAMFLHAVHVIPISILGLMFFVVEWLVPKASEAH